jgi:hypothetical protein
MSWFTASFADIADPRTGNAKRHDLLEVLTIALTAAICGAEHCSDFADFAADRADLFGEFLAIAERRSEPRHLQPGFPVAGSGGVFGLLRSVRRSHGAFVEGVIAIDGKTLRRSFDTAAKRSPLAVVTAFASATQTVIGQEGFRAGDGDSEILTAPGAARMPRPYRPIGDGGCDPLPERHGAGDPRSGRRLSVAAEGQPAGACSRGGGLFCRSAVACRVATGRDDGCRPRPYRGAALLGQPRPVLSERTEDGGR